MADQTTGDQAARTSWELPLTSPIDGDDGDSWRIVPREIDVTVAHPARRYDYWLGGKDNFPADRASGDTIAESFPNIRTAVLENRRFLRRAVRFLTGEAGIDQYLDIGTGIPSADNTHEVAQRLRPESRVVYVDNDPVVLAHARALLTSEGGAGVTAYIDADVRDPAAILGDPAFTETLDLGRPVALMMIAVMHFITDEHAPYEIVRSLTGALPSGSYLAMTHVTNDFYPPETLRSFDFDPSKHGDFRMRNREEFARFFSGLDLIDPGIVTVGDWRAQDEPGPRPTAEETAVYAAVGRIP